MDVESSAEPMKAINGGLVPHIAAEPFHRSKIASPKHPAAHPDPISAPLVPPRHREAASKPPRGLEAAFKSPRGLHPRWSPLRRRPLANRLAVLRVRPLYPGV